MKKQKEDHCELCGIRILIPEMDLPGCPHPGNGYCAHFRWKAQKDAVEVGMKKPTNKK